MYQQLWGYKVEEKLYLGVREQIRLNTTALDQWFSNFITHGTLFQTEIFPGTPPVFLEFVM
jgi:hypothetical protein